ncbi:MAG: outer membrane protein assembly factor BamE [Gammaproteobacteria bacterium]|nr:outer membrane protein assembly factor BamE [Gammaproteobacteria bacterium]MDH5802241.1 outer membrane protein assembly factor BamE [Gammaproteobacteria bacterium]
MFKTVLSLLIVTIFSACTAHRVDVQQGNVLTKETMDKVKIGMSERQIKALLGTPLITDPFRKNRWDFVYRMKHGETQEVQYSYVTLFFSDAKLSEIKVHQEPLAEKDLKTPGLGTRSLFSNH